MHGLSIGCPWILDITSSTVSLSITKCISTLLNRTPLVDITFHVLYNSFYWTLIPDHAILCEIAGAFSSLPCPHIPGGFQVEWFCSTYSLMDSIYSPMDSTYSSMDSTYYSIDSTY